MKRILSLILSLILCLGFIVSCEKEEAISSSNESSSQEHSSSEESSTKETLSSQSGQEQSSSSFPPMTTPSVSIEAKPEEYYEIVFQKRGYQLDDSKLFVSYEELMEEIGNQDDFEISIDSSVFEKNYVCAINTSYTSGISAEMFYDFKCINGIAYFKAWTISTAPPGVDVTHELHSWCYFIILPKSLFLDDLSPYFNETKIFNIEPDGTFYDLERKFEGIYW